MAIFNAPLTKVWIFTVNERVWLQSWQMKIHKLSFGNVYLTLVLWLKCKHFFEGGPFLPVSSLVFIPCYFCNCYSIDVWNSAGLQFNVFLHLNGMHKIGIQIRKVTENFISSCLIDYYVFCDFSYSVSFLEKDMKIPLSLMVLYAAVKLTNSTCREYLCLNFYPFFMSARCVEEQGGTGC